MEQVGNDLTGERIEYDSIITHIAIVKTSCGLDPIFDIHQFLLQFEKVFVSLQVRVRLSNCEKFLDCANQLLFGSNLMSDATVVRQANITQLSHPLEYFLLMLGIALHCRHNIREQLIAP